VLRLIKDFCYDGSSPLLPNRSLSPVYGVEDLSTLHPQSPYPAFRKRYEVVAFIPAYNMCTALCTTLLRWACELGALKFPVAIFSLRSTTEGPPAEEREHAFLQPPAPCQIQRGENSILEVAYVEMKTLQGMMLQAGRRGGIDVLGSERHAQTRTEVVVVES